MNQSTLHILIFGTDVKVTESATTRLRAQGIEAEALVISNIPESDTAIAHIIDARKWDGLIIGHGIRQNHEWFERVMHIVKNARQNISLIDTKGPNDVENAIKRHFNDTPSLTKT